MKYGYRLYSGTEFCALGLGYDTRDECAGEVLERFRSTAGQGYYTHAEIVTGGEVIETINNEVTK